MSSTLCSNLAFGLHAACIGAQVEACAKEDIPSLAAGYGPAEIDSLITQANGARDEAAAFALRSVAGFGRLTPWPARSMARERASAI